MLYFCAANAQNHGIAISINTFNLDTILKYRDKDPFISLQYLHKAQSNAQNLPEHSTIAEILYHKGYIYRQLGLYDIALTNYLWSLSIADKAKDRCLDAWVLLDIANLYRDKKNSDKLALEYYENARKRFSDYQDLIGSIVTNFSEAELHMNNRSYNTAIHLLEIANSTSSMLGEKNQKAKVLMLLGQVYLQKKEPSKANAYFGELMRLGSDKKSSEMMASAYKGYASIAIFKGKINEGITFFFAALECYKRINDKTNIVFTLDKIGQTYFENGNFSDASKHTEMALVAAENNNYIIQQRILLKKLSIYYAASKDFETANTKQNKYIALLENEAINNSALIQNEYKMEAQRKENAALNNWTKNQRMLISICIFSGLAFLMLLFVAVTKNKKLQESHINLLAKGTELQKKKNELIALNTQKIQQNQQQLALLNSLNHLITEGKVYSNEDITLKNLSQELSTNEVLLSQIIDDIYSCTFFEFINECRIKEAQKILLNPEFKMKTIKNIASRIGFSTKAEFVDEFQKIVGVTPAIFLKMKNLS